MIHAKPFIVGACGLAALVGCAEWGWQPEATTPQPAQAKITQPVSADDPDLANAPTGDQLDAPGDTIAAEAVKQYLADLDAVHAAAAKPAPVRDTTSANATITSDQAVAAPVHPRGAEPAARIENIAATQAIQTNTPVTIETAAASAGDTQPAAQPAAQNSAPTDVVQMLDVSAARPRVVAVSLVGQPEPSAAANGATTVSNTGISTVGAASIDRLIDQAAADLARQPSDARLQWRLSLLQLAAGRIADAGNLSPELTERQRGLLARQVALEAALANVLADSASGPGPAYAAVEALRDALRTDAELSLPTLTLCTRVTTFGVYDEMPESMLAAYQANRAIVYCEVRNLASERQGADRHRSLLATRLELFTEDGRSVWLHEESRIEDVSRQRREDFFIAQMVTFPATLGPGQYVLKATITDLVAQKTNETTRQLRIGGERALSAASAP